MEQLYTPAYLKGSEMQNVVNRVRAYYRMETFDAKVF
jgi:hypothetical protein